MPAHLPRRQVRKSGATTFCSLTQRRDTQGPQPKHDEWRRRVRGAGGLPSRRADPDGDGGVEVRLVPFDEIKTNGFDLNIGRYVQAATEEVSDLPAALTAYQAARAARIAAESRMFQVLTAAGIEIGDE